MTTEELQAHIKAISAAYHNDVLQYRDSEGVWCYPDLGDNRFLDSGVRWRIKPKPREVDLFAPAGEKPQCQNCGANLGRFNINFPVEQNWRKFREVIDE